MISDGHGFQYYSIVLFLASVCFYHILFLSGLSISRLEPEKRPVLPLIRRRAASLAVKVYVKEGFVNNEWAYISSNMGTPTNLSLVGMVFNIVFTCSPAFLRGLKHVQPTTNQ